MGAITVGVKHKGKKYDVELEPSSTGEDFKLQLYSLTGVEPDRQKVLIKGGQLKDDAIISELGLKNGQQLMMLGTASEDGTFARPTEKIKFVEDMTEAEAAQQVGATPAGLVNLGNTCYLNSTLQVLKSIPELQENLVNYNAPSSSGSLGLMPGANVDLTNQLRNLYKAMSQTQEGYEPHAFISALRVAFPQFAERSKSGAGFAQQDAEEAWSQIIAQLRQKINLKDGGDNSKAVSFIDKYMAGEFTTTLECEDPQARDLGEEPKSFKESFLKLNCHIDSSTNHLRDGIMNGMTEKIEKRSDVLDRDTTYNKQSRISHLPKYLTVHFVRFFWRRDVQKKAKIMRKVTFPQELDAIEFCTDELKKALIPVRDKVREIRKDEEDIERARKKRKRNHTVEDGDITGSFGASDADRKKKEEKEKKDGKKTSKSADGDVQMGEGETYKTDAEFEAEKEASLLAAKKELHALINPELLKNDGANQSGLYELRGVVTHQGASADSGHYTAYVKKTAPVDPKTGKKGEEDGNWWWFNDDKVSEVTPDKIDGLSGGGESHSALILLYKAIPLPSAEGITE
ncbi:cysteine proteinase [Coniochaeta ligniaria NRRL 30616]|uniref:Ubiquitin carboxyl-terminal hydrolase n=1 Tax=Coniochaeta ligniaria NRRL 30616 TaxID=1408157 RepID=A0A1J7JMU1_9PEZI|nr:cysteine proteinase [Coniochaeta ligniaria NRRL 30616]